MGGEFIENQPNWDPKTVLIPALCQSLVPSLRGSERFGARKRSDQGRNREPVETKRHLPLLFCQGEEFRAFFRVQSDLLPRLLSKNGRRGLEEWRCF